MPQPAAGAGRARKSAAQGPCIARGAPDASAKPACAVAGANQTGPGERTLVSGAHLLIAADCTAYAYADFHNRFMRRHVTLIGCPKLDGVDYAEKLTAILRENEIKSVTVVRMQVPCCGGLEQAVKTALQASGKFIPWQVAVISTEGNLLEL